MSKIKRTSILVLRLLLAFISMLVAYILSTMVIRTNIIMTPKEASQAGRALVFASLFHALVLSFLILRSPRHGLKFVGTLIIVHFGVETFMAQIETLYFNSAVQMGIAEFIGIVVMGAVQALIFAPLAVFIFGKMKKSAKPEEKGKAAVPSEWSKRFIALTVFYVVVYFLFGYFVAWQWEETRLYYTGTTAIKPFIDHFWDLFIIEDPIIIPFQLVRGALWTLLAMIIVRMMKAKRWEGSLAVALTFLVLFGLPLGLFPNPYMPVMVARSHFVEVSSSMLLFGGIAGWVIHSNEG